MKVIVIGTGFVGLTHAAVCSEYGHEVYAYDIDRERIAAYQTGQRQEIERYVNEPELAAIVQERLARSLFFCNELAPIIEGVEVIFLCVPTPAGLDGATDLSSYLAAVSVLAPLLAQRRDAGRVVIVNKSTVPVGTARSLAQILQEYQVPNVGVASNPEFLPEGDAVEKSRRPDRVLIGADDQQDFQLLRLLYSQFVHHVRIRYIETTPETAEASKYVANSLLFTAISFWNGVAARLAETDEKIRLDELRMAVTADSRISPWGSYVSNGAGGSCFGKDIQSLIRQLRTGGQQTPLLDSVYAINEEQKTYLLERAEQQGISFQGKTVALVGLAFKQRTNDIRDASSLALIEALLQRGVSAIRTYDPMALNNARRMFTPEKNPLYSKISYHESAQEALQGSHAVCISTDWQEFRGLSRTIRQTVSPPYVILDGRRMLPDAAELVRAGYDYVAVGSVYLQAQEQKAEEQ
ncbi:UDP-glucose/GDP-mannose dehydrogenase family protein [Ktedonosporobacter rubrisoli]|uniref:UDP-glucose 6-dehydrogenase n=1 Tax=Ktedonosporobacter rubrisoli TaxID=2509675 RepID=A0A4P6JP83_KTERU|nr:nucleotide sugar dehydrogenase [Ktedonosporobacter rubrisoli]QBD76940.1 UDP-glucose/GDP-mannose dehydrogenase family protein [Ktedonosporobacter rubrisoli]